MAAMVAGTLTSPRYALAAALAVSVAVHAAALEWWRPALSRTSVPSAPSLPELRATLLEEQVVAEPPAAIESPPLAARPTVTAATPAATQRLAVRTNVVAPSIMPEADAVSAAAPIATTLPAPEPPAIPSVPPAAAVPAGPASGYAAAHIVTLADAGGAAVAATASATTPIAYRDNPSPPYPDAARRDGQQGLTVLEVLVSRDGLPIDVAIVATSGFSELDAAAAAGLRHWRFFPAMRDREPIDARIRIPVRFRLTADGR